MLKVDILQLSSNVSDKLTETERYIMGGGTIAGENVTINARKIYGNGAEILGTKDVNLNADDISLKGSTVISGK